MSSVIILDSSDSEDERKVITTKCPATAKRVIPTKSILSPTTATPIATTITKKLSVSALSSDPIVKNAKATSHTGTFVFRARNNSIIKTFEKNEIPKPSIQKINIPSGITVTRHVTPTSKNSSALNANSPKLNNSQKIINCFFDKIVQKSNTKTTTTTSMTTTTTKPKTAPIIPQSNRIYVADRSTPQTGQELSKIGSNKHVVTSNTMTTPSSTITLQKNNNGTMQRVQTIATKVVQDAVKRRSNTPTQLNTPSTSTAATSKMTAITIPTFQQQQQIAKQYIKGNAASVPIRILGATTPNKSATPAVSRTLSATTPIIKQTAPTTYNITIPKLAAAELRIPTPPHIWDTHNPTARTPTTAPSTSHDNRSYVLERPIKQIGSGLLTNASRAVKEVSETATATASSSTSIMSATSMLPIISSVQSLTASATPPLRLLASPPPSPVASPLPLNSPKSMGINEDLTNTLRLSPVAAKSIIRTATTTPSPLASPRNLNVSPISPNSTTTIKSNIAPNNKTNVPETSIKRIKPITVLAKSDEAWQDRANKPKQTEETKEKLTTATKEKPSTLLAALAPVKERMPDALEPEYDELLRECRKADPTPDMERLIKIKLLKYYHSVHASFVSSRGFRKTVRGVIASIRKEPNMVYLYLKTVVDELKARQKAKFFIEEPSESEISDCSNSQGKLSEKQLVIPTAGIGSRSPANCTSKSTASSSPPSSSHVNASISSTPPANDMESSTTGNKRTDEHIRKLNRALYILTKRIETLDQAEVDWNDDDSSYLQVERYKKRACQIYEKICDLTGEHKHAHRVIRKSIQFRETPYPQFNRVLQGFINQTREFPDYQDVLRMLEHCNIQYEMGLANFEVKRIAHDAFTKVGKILQTRRKTDLYETVTHFTSNLKDPAAEDPELAAKLNENQKHYKKISDVIEKYAREQNLTAEERLQAKHKEQEEEALTQIAEDSNETTKCKDKSINKDQSKKDENPYLDSDDDEDDDGDDDDEEQATETFINSVQVDSIANGDLSDDDTDINIKDKIIDLDASDIVIEESQELDNASIEALNSEHLEEISPPPSKKSKLCFDGLLDEEYEESRETNNKRVKLKSDVLLDGHLILPQDLLEQHIDFTNTMSDIVKHNNNNNNNKSHNNNIQMRAKTGSNAHATAATPATVATAIVPNGRVIQKQRQTTTETSGVQQQTSKTLKIMSVSSLNASIPNQAQQQHRRHQQKQNLQQQLKTQKNVCDLSTSICESMAEIIISDEDS